MSEEYKNSLKNRVIRYQVDRITANENLLKGLKHVFFRKKTIGKIKGPYKK